MTADLSTRYLGLDLTSPLVASASPLTGRLDMLERLEAAGAGAVVLPSLFEEEIVDAAFEAHALHLQGAGVFAEALTYLPEPADAPGPADRYLEHLVAAKRRVAIPVIASLNGTTKGGWVRYASELEEAGADGLERNVYLVAADATDTAVSVENRLVELVSSVRAATRIPIAVKLSPYFSAIGDLARKLAATGVDGLVLFNRFYQPDIDLEALSVAPTLELSTPSELRLPLRWIALLFGQVPCSLALTGGVHSGADAVKALLAGADVAMTTSSLLRHGPEHLATLRDGLCAWLHEHDYESVAQLRGSMSQRSVPDPDAYERANYFRVLRRASHRYLPLP